MIMRLIKTEADYEAALASIDGLMDSAPGTPAYDELELLSTLVELYEKDNHPIEPPDPIDAIKFRMEQADLKPKDLVPLLGSRAKVSEVLSGKRPLTLSMIRALHEKLGIPAHVLLQEADATLPSKAVPNPEKFPWKEIVSRNWLAPFFHGSVEQAIEKCEELATYLLRNFHAQGLQWAFRQTANIRGGNLDRHALFAWTAHIVNEAQKTMNPVKYKKGSIDDAFMRNLVTLSYLDNGPLLAKEFLAKHGIILVIERYLSKTHVDGAAIFLQDGTPVIGLSLRHDRIDNFWFTLFHELAHICLHLEGKNAPDWFVDDLDMAADRSQEKEADKWAQQMLIAPKDWQWLQQCQSTEDVEQAAQRLRINRAIIAGRLRRERNNYKLFARLVGQGEVRSLFGVAA